MMALASQVLIPLVRAWSDRTYEADALRGNDYRLNPFSQGVVRQDKVARLDRCVSLRLNPFSQGVVRQD